MGRSCATIDGSATTSLRACLSGYDYQIARNPAPPKRVDYNWATAGPSQDLEAHEQLCSAEGCISDSLSLTHLPSTTLEIWFVSAKW